MKFRIGDQPSIALNLPSKIPGNGSVYLGKAHFEVSALKTSADIKISVDSVNDFLKKLEKMHTELKGEATLKSDCELLSLKIAVRPTGHIAVVSSLATSQFRQPSNTHWSCNCEFSFQPQLLAKTLASINGS